MPAAEADVVLVGVAKRYRTLLLVVVVAAMLSEANCVFGTLALAVVIADCPHAH
jgi:hypothetical protein